VWPNYNWQGNDYDDEVEFFETWYFNRLSWIDNNVPGTLLYPSAELSGSYPDFEITLTDDYFSRQYLNKNHFILNNLPPEVSIDTVIYLNASQATIILNGNISGPIPISVTMRAKVLNSFDDLTTNELIVGVGSNTNELPNTVLYNSRNTIHLECNYPNRIGDHIEVYKLSGQLVFPSKIEKTQVNSFYINVHPGFYLCSYWYDGKKQTQQVVFVK